MFAAEIMYILKEANEHILGGAVIVNNSYTFLITIWLPGNENPLYKYGFRTYADRHTRCPNVLKRKAREVRVSFQFFRSLNFVHKLAWS